MSKVKQESSKSYKNYKCNLYVLISLLKLVWENLYENNSKWPLQIRIWNAAIIITNILYKMSHITSWKYLVFKKNKMLNSKIISLEL